jgi:hypothetical protein
LDFPFAGEVKSSSYNNLEDLALTIFSFTLCSAAEWNGSFFFPSLFFLISYP